jgi:hypothetical protein
MQEAITNAEQAREAAVVSRDEARAKAANAALPADDRAEFAKYADALDGVIAEADKAIEVIKSGTNPDGTINYENMAATAGGLVPPPWGPVIGLAGVLIPMALGWRRAHQGLASTVAGLEAAKAKDPEFAAGFKRNADVISEAQTWYAYRYIDENTGNETTITTIAEN